MYATVRYVTARYLEPIMAGDVDMRDSEPPGDASAVSSGELRGRLGHIQSCLENGFSNMTEQIQALRSEVGGAARSPTKVSVCLHHTH